MRIEIKGLDLVCVMRGQECMKATARTKVNNSISGSREVSLSILNDEKRKRKRGHEAMRTKEKLTSMLSHKQTLHLLRSIYASYAHHQKTCAIIDG